MKKTHPGAKFKAIIRGDWYGVQKYAVVQFDHRGHPIEGSGEYFNLSKEGKLQAEKVYHSIDLEPLPERIQARLYPHYRNKIWTPSQDRASMEPSTLTSNNRYNIKNLKKKEI